MFRNLFTLLVVGALGYWYYNGPFQDRANPSQGAQLKDNAKKMELCLRGEDLRTEFNRGRAAATLLNAARAATTCSLPNGAWHSREP